jgi:hypothetical protein
MKRPILILLLLASAIASYGSSCNDPFDGPTIPPPLIVRSVTPADSVQLGSYDPFDLSITFNRVLTLDEITVRVVPAPAASGQLTTTGSGRNVAWFGLALDPTRPAHRLLLDGASMSRPFSIQWYTPGTLPHAFFSGKITSDDPRKVSALGAVVFALDLQAAFNPLEPGSLTQVEPKAITVVTAVNGTGDAAYAIGNLAEDSKYIVVAVFDSSGDAVYDPSEDWWGFYGNQLANDPDTVVARSVLDEDKPPPETHIDIKLRAPR